ncbi:ABC-2 type transport system permease protein [Lachnospiraceae bacterium RM5]|nr:ABC-2 type transport system permease protein [Lachnospiraceae bacterium RM5]
MSRYIQNFKKFLPLLKELVSRDIKIKYRHSILGVLWTLLNPLLMMIVLSIVFSHLFRFEIENFPVYLLCGQVIFNFYNDATTSAMSSIIANASLIRKMYIPKYLFTISKILSSVINIMASFCALIIVMVCMRVELHLTILLAIFPIALIVIFSTGVGLIIAALTVKFRDILHLYSVFTTVLMYLTPVIYPMSILYGPVYKIVRLNPLTNILIMFRDVIMYDTISGWKTIVAGVVPSVAILFIGVIVFYKRQDTFILDI